MREDMVAKFLYSPRFKERKRPEKTERRKLLESKILYTFEMALNISNTREYGIGKYSIKHDLVHIDKNLDISINTVKRIVDEFVADGIIECINPNDTTNLKFKLISKCNDSIDSKRVLLKDE